jgi:cytochrome b561
MAIMLVAMPFIGVAMMASMDDYHWLLAIHRPLGIAVLVLAVIRLVNRRLTRMPPLPPTMSPLDPTLKPFEGIWAFTEGDP